LNIRIGAHSDYLGKLNRYRSDLKRWPEISYTRGLNQTATEISSTHGGIIYLEFSAQSAVGDTLTLTLSGRMGMVPSFSSKTGSQQIADTAKAPWAELYGRSIVLTVPADKLENVRKPAALLNFWDRAVWAAAGFAGVDSFKCKELIVADLQISSGYMHSGHPIVCHLDALDRMLNLDNKLFTEGSWGLFHELGHNFQHQAYTFEGAGEVCVNFFTLYIMDKVLNLKPQQTSWLQKNELKEYFSKPVSFNSWKENPKTALLTFVPLINSFGWEILKSVCIDMVKLEKQQGWLSDADKRDCWVKFYSEKSGYNLTHYFDLWGFEFSSTLYKELSYLPVWNRSAESIVLEYSR